MTLAEEVVGKEKQSAADQVLRRAANELNPRRAGVPVPKIKKNSFCRRRSTNNAASTEARVSLPTATGNEESIGGGAETPGPPPLQLQGWRRTRRRREGRSEGRLARDGHVQHSARGTVATPEKRSDRIRRELTHSVPHRNRNSAVLRRFSPPAKY